MNHIKEIAHALPEYELDAMLITSAPGERYAVGFHGEGVVLITREAAYYYTDTRYIEAARETVTDAVVALPEKKKTYQETVQALVQQHTLTRLGFEDRSMTVSQYRRWNDKLSAELLPASELLASLRKSKGEEELSYICRAQEIAEEALLEILSFLRPGLTEQEVAARLQYEMLLRGAQGMSFDPIVVSGPNGSRPHGVPGARQIGKGEFVTMDFGCIADGYCSDMTRTVAIGAPDAEMRRVYDVVWEAQLAGIAAARAGITGAEIHGAAHAVIAGAGYGDFFGHSFGHGIGLEVHEEPSVGPASKNTLPIGAVVSAEPGIYLPGRFGVRIEDMLVLTADGARNLTHAGKELIIL
ncbi:MAG: aminopeptidase P family protein [Oscillospiraceae bacterium]|nr:aminopeptidase P family protein [Oscillospiraceae bacterium]